MNSNFSYSGTVKLKIKGKPTITRHNEGMPLFFNTLCQIIGHSYTNFDDLNNSLPSNIDLYSKTGNSILKSPIPIVKREVTRWSESNAPSVMLSGLLNKNNIDGDNTPDSSIYVKLLDGNGNELAHLELSNNALSDFNSTELSQATIEWTMKFENKTSANTDNTNKDEGEQ